MALPIHWWCFESVSVVRRDYIHLSKLLHFHMIFSVFLVLFFVVVVVFWLISLSIITWRFARTVCTNSQVLFLAGKYSIVCTLHNVFIHTVPCHWTSEFFPIVDYYT